MANISLACFCLRVRQKREVDNYYKTDDLPGGKDFFDYLESYFKQRKLSAVKIDKEKTKKHLKVVKLNVDSKIRKISGLFQAGDYGYEQKIINVNTEDLKHTQTPEEAATIPYYFLVRLPSHSDKGYLILQRFGVHGIQEAIQHDVKTYFNDNHPNIFIENDLVVPETLFREYLQKGQVARINFRRYGLPKSMEDLYDGLIPKDEIGYVDISVHPQKNKFLTIAEKINSFLSGKKKFDSLIQIQGFEYNTVQVDVKINGSLRRIDLSREKEIRAYFNVTDSLSLQDSGHPRFESIDVEAQKLLDDLLTDTTHR